MMTNDELGQAIVATQDRLRLVGTAYAEHPILVEHLKALLAEQLKRATEETSAEQGCEHCGSLEVNPKCPACQGIER